MSRKLTLLAMMVCLLFLVVGLAGADPDPGFKGVKVDGELTTKVFSVRNYRGSGVSDQYVLNRALISLNTRLTDGVSAMVVLGKNSTWGKSVSTYQGVEPGASEYLVGDGSTLEKIGIYNAYIKLNDVPRGVRLTIGRQFAGEAEDAFFFYGPQNGRILGVTSIDALKAEWDWGPMEMIALAGKKSESGLGDGSGRDPTYPDSVAYVSDEDVNIYALQATSTKLLPEQTVKASVYARRRGLQTGNQRDDLMLFVFRSQGPIWRGLEYDAMLGIDAGENEAEDKTYRGWLGRGIGYYKTNIPSLCGLKLTGGYVYVSGDNPSTKDKDEHFARISRDCFYSMAVIVYEILNDTPPEQVTNVTIPFGGLEVVPEAFGGKLTLKAMGSDLGCAQPIAGYDKKGSEVDLSLRYAPRDNFSVGLVWAKFQPKGILEAVFGPDPTTQVTVDFTVKF